MKSNTANDVKYNYFLDGGGIDNVTLRLWKFSDSCSRYTVDAAGDDMIYHILVLDANRNHDIKFQKSETENVRQHADLFRIETVPLHMIRG